MKKKILLLITFIISLYIFMQFNNVNNLKENCINLTFEKKIEKTGIKEGKIYNFSEIFDCKKWDKLIIVGGKNANRTIIFLKEGVALPNINYRNRISGGLLFYFIKDGKLISPPFEYWQSGFLYFKDFNDFDYIIIDRENAKFKCVELETIGPGPKILTFEQIE